MTLWQRYAFVAYPAVLLGVVGHASSEFVSVLCGTSGPELSVWRVLLGGAGLVVMALLFPTSRDLFEPFKTDGIRLILLYLNLDDLVLLMFYGTVRLYSQPLHHFSLLS